jgi:DNA replication protein DnaC
MNNNQATLQKLEQMRLHGMSRAFRGTMESGAKNHFTPDELLSHVVDAEWDERHNRRLQRLLKAARLRYPAGFEEIDFALNRNLDKNQLLRLSDCRWIEEHQDVIVSGPCGSGKSFLACALGTQACLYGYRVGYYAASKLFGQLKLSRADGSYLKELGRIQKQALIILDDFGLQSLDAPSRLSLLEILEDRYGRASSIVVSQLPVSAWHETIGDPTIADAICDRIVHGAYRIELKGESVRKLYTQRKAEKKGRLV